MRRLMIISYIFFLSTLTACVPGNEAVHEGKPRAKELQSVEIREYEGEALSSLMGWRDNSIKGPQHIDIDEYTLEIAGLVEKPVSFTYDEALAKDGYTKVITLHCVEGWSKQILWEGILVVDLMDDAGVKPEANTVIFHARDGYTTSLPLDYIRDNDILLAYKMNGVTIPPERGYPFELVAENKWGYKWIKWVTRIELSDNPDYRGFWEQRGYDNDADITGPKRG